MDTIAAPGTLEALRFDNRYAKLGDAFSEERLPEGLPEPVLAAFAPDVAALIGLDPAEAQRQFCWTERLWQELSLLGGVRRNGAGTSDSIQRLPNTLNVSFLGLHGEDLLIGLDLAGLAVSSGSACLVGSVQPSHVLAAMGVPAEWASATVRFSIGPQIRDEDLGEIANRVRQVVRHQRSLRGWTPDQTCDKLLPQEALA